MWSNKTPCNDLPKEQNYKDIWNLVFKCSLLLYPITILLAIILGTIIGIDSGWPMPAWSDGTKMYGMQAIISYLVIFGVAFSWVYISIIIYQVGYIIYKILFAVRDVYLKRK